MGRCIGPHERTYRDRVIRALVLTLLVASWIGALWAVYGCVPAPTTRLNLATGQYESPKDIRAERISVRADGTGQREVEIVGLDSSASAVLIAQAQAMRDQAAAAKAIGEALAAALREIRSVP